VHYDGRRASYCHHRQSEREKIEWVRYDGGYSPHARDGLRIFSSLNLKKSTGASDVKRMVLLISDVSEKALPSSLKNKES